MTDGERWTRNLLADLREARFGASGWTRFFGDSFSRACEQRQARPRASRETVAAGVAGLVVWGGAAASGHRVLALVGAGWWLLVVVLLVLHLGMLETPDGRPVGRLGVPNLLTLGRAGVIPALPALSPWLVAWALLAAVVSDVLDGALARGRGPVTRLGFWLDRTVDGLLVGSAGTALAAAGRLPWWAAALVLLRVALPWLSTPFWFARAWFPTPARHVSGRLSGAVLVAGLAAAGFAAPGATVTTAAGALGGIATFALALSRAYPSGDRLSRGHEGEADAAPGLVGLEPAHSTEDAASCSHRADSSRGWTSSPVLALSAAPPSGRHRRSSGL